MYGLEMYGLECDGETCVDIDTRLGIIPTTTAAIHKAARLSTTIIRILGVEDIIDLTQ